MLSLFSFSDMDLDEGNLNVPYADKIVHFTFYLVFSILGCLLVRERTKGLWSMGKATRVIVVSAISYGIVIEVLQYTLTEDRMAEFGDVVANTLGAFVGIGLIRWLLPIWSLALPKMIRGICCEAQSWQAFATTPKN